MSEFWPQDYWPNCIIPRPGIIRRICCHFFGHRWATDFWVGQEEPNWPQYEYCQVCWLHRDMIKSEDLGELILNNDCSKQITTDQNKLQQIKNLIEEWANKQGHDSCWFYPEIFLQIAKIVDASINDQSLPPYEEFKLGCQKYQQEIYRLEKQNGSG